MSLNYESVLFESLEPRVLLAAAPAWATYLGGAQDEVGGASKLDSKGNLIVCGDTSSSNFPTLNACDASFAGGVPQGYDATISKYSSSGKLLWSTYLGGNGYEHESKVFVDSADNIWFVTLTSSSNMPSAGSGFDHTYDDGSDAGCDLFVAKFSSGGSLLWTTYLGGSGYEDSWGSIDGKEFDAQGNLLLCGITTSTDFPTTAGAYQRTSKSDFFQPPGDGFVAKVGAAGNLVWSTLLGGSGYEESIAIAQDASGNIIASGTTWSSDFPTTAGTFDQTYNGPAFEDVYEGGDVFVAKLNSTGSQLIWSTLIGGSGVDGGFASLDTGGNIIVSGTTDSHDFPVSPGAYQSANGGGMVDGFLAKLNSSGQRLWATYLGGNGMDGVAACNFDSTGFYLNGWTSSTNFPTVNAWDASYNGGWSDIVLGRFNNNGTPAWMTYFGGSKDDSLTFEKPSGGELVICGDTASVDLPMLGTGFDRTYNGGDGDIFAAKFNSAGVPTWSTFYGGNGDDHVSSCDWDGSGNLNVVGWTSSKNFPVLSAQQGAYAGGAHDMLVARIAGIAGGGTVISAPEIDVVGNGVSILDGDSTPSAADWTSFGSVSYASGSVTRTFTIKNTGTASLNLTGSPRVSISGANAADFTVTAPPTVSSIAAGAQTTFKIKFDPSSAGAKTAMVSIADNDSNENPYNFTIGGTGAAPQEIAIYGNGHTINDGDTTPVITDWTDFSSVSYSSGSVTRTFTIKSLGGMPLNLTGNPKVVISGANAADFAVTAQPTVSSIAAGAQTTFKIKFDPSSTGAKTAMISIANNDSDENPYNFVIKGTGAVPQEIAIYGNGHTINDGDTTPALTDWTDFGSVSYSSGVVTRTFTIKNLGGMPLNLTGNPKVVISGTNAADFTVTAPLTVSSIAAGAQATFQIKFDPSARGLRKAIISILSNDGDESLYDFVIQGTGL